jgi:hypothetical protein
VRAIAATGVGPGSASSVVNSGDLVVRSTSGLATLDTQAKGIYAGTYGANSPLSVINSGDITVTGVGQVFGIQAATGSPYAPSPVGANSPIIVRNSGDIQTSGTGYIDVGIQAKAFGANSPISIENSGDIDPTTGIEVRTYADNSPVDVDHSGDIEASRGGILAASLGANSTVTVTNSGTVALTGDDTSSNAAIIAAALGPGSNIFIDNSGILQGIGLRGVGISRSEMTSSVTSRVARCSPPPMPS